MTVSGLSEQTITAPPAKPSPIAVTGILLAAMVLASLVNAAVAAYRRALPVTEARP